MQKLFTNLTKLQDILSKKFQIQQEIQEIPLTLKSKNEVYNRIKKNYLEKYQKIKEYEDKLLELKRELGESILHKDKIDERTKLITTQKEYEALDKEKNIITDKILTLEKNIDHNQKLLTELKEAINDQEQRLTLQESEIEEEKKSTEEEISGKEIEIEKLDKEAEILNQGLDNEMIYKFERIVKNKEGVGIVSINEGFCNGCNLLLPPQFILDVREEQEVKYCPNCSRILYFEEKPKQEQVINFFAEEFKSKI